MVKAVLKSKKIASDIIRGETLAQYSKMLDVSIDVFTDLVRNEVAEKMNVNNGDDSADRYLIEKAMVSYQGIDSHLRAEYRRIKTRYLQCINILDKKENDAINFARSELSSKATEKQIKTKAYESVPELFQLQSECESIEQKMKFVKGMIDNIDRTMSCVQTLTNLLRDEIGVAKVS